MNISNIHHYVWVGSMFLPVVIILTVVSPLCPSLCMCEKQCHIIDYSLFFR